MLIAEILRREAYQPVIETIDMFFNKYIYAAKCKDQQTCEKRKAIIARSLKQRAENFHDSITRFGILSTLSFYIYKASDTYSRLDNILQGIEDQSSQRSKPSRKEGDYGYSLLLRALFNYLENLSRKSEIPEICSLVQKIMPCKPRKPGDLTQMLRNLSRLEPRETDLLYIVIKAFSEASKTVSAIYEARFEKR